MQFNDRIKESHASDHMKELTVFISKEIACSPGKHPLLEEQTLCYWCYCYQVAIECPCRVIEFWWLWDHTPTWCHYIVHASMCERCQCDLVCPCTPLCCVHVCRHVFGIQVSLDHKIQCVFISLWTMFCIISVPIPLLNMRWVFMEHAVAVRLHISVKYVLHS